MGDQKWERVWKRNLCSLRNAKSSQNCCTPKITSELLHWQIFLTLHPSCIQIWFQDISSNIWISRPISAYLVQFHDISSNFTISHPISGYLVQFLDISSNFCISCPIPGYLIEFQDILSNFCISYSNSRISSGHSWIWSPSGSLLNIEHTFVALLYRVQAWIRRRNSWSP